MRKIGLCTSLVTFLSVFSHAACDSTLTPTHTSRLGLAVSQINSCSWGTVIQNNWSILDSSSVVLNASNVFSGSSTVFTYGITISSEINTDMQIFTVGSKPWIVGSVNNFYAGYSAGLNNTDPFATNGNVGIGPFALEVATNLDFNNAALGYLSLGSVNGASDNTGIGNLALPFDTTGFNNTCVGFDCLGNLVSGANNVAIGYKAGSNDGLATLAPIYDSSMTYIGASTGHGTSAPAHTFLNYGIAIGAGALLTSSHTAQIGGTNGSGTEVMLNTSSATLNGLTVNSQAILATGAGIGYGVATPSFNIDFRCDSNSAIDCANITHSNGTALNAVSTSNNPALTATNSTVGSSAYAIQATQLGGTSAALNSQTDVSTAIYATATSGTGILAKSSAGNAIQVDTGKVFINSSIYAASGTVSTATFNYAQITASNTKSIALGVTENAMAGGAIQDDSSGAVNIKQLGIGDALVIVSSYSDAQVGTSDILILDRSINRNDPLIRIIRNSNNSAPDFRVDAPAPNMEQVATSTDNAHGRGKWEPYATPSQSEILQVNSRAWDNTTFENVAYWEPLDIQSSVATPGLFIRTQTLDNDSGILVSTNTGGINFFTQNNHTVGLAGPLNVALGSWRFRLPHTLNNLGEVLYQSDNGDAFNDRTWEFTVNGLTGAPLTFNSGTAPTWSTQLSSISVVASNTATYDMLISSSATSFHVAISTSGHVITAGPSPTISTCGTTPNGSVVGNDNAGTITVGGGAVTACTLTFANTWGASPVCVITDNSTATTGDISSISATAFTASFSVSVGGGTIWYRCECTGASCR